MTVIRKGNDTSKRDGGQRNRGKVFKWNIFYVFIINNFFFQSITACEQIIELIETKMQPSFSPSAKRSFTTNPLLKFDSTRVSCQNKPV